MKKNVVLLLSLVLVTTIAFAQKKAKKETEIDVEALIKQKLDSVENTFTYQHGTIALKGGVAKIVVPEGFKYLNAEQAERVLVDMWGNPKSDNMTYGLVLPEKQHILDEQGYVFNVQYDEIGYVKDDDADKINYDDLAKQMRESTDEENAARKKDGYDPIHFIGWAAKPFYDKEKKILHWAKEIKFGDSAEVNTLNYNIRVLGRKGVLVLNAIGTMDNLPLVQKDVPKVLDIVQFNEGYQYKNFDSSIDQVAAITIGGLVAGKVLAKVGLLAVILKFWKIGLLAVAGFFRVFWSRITGKKNEDVA
jgi:uncharacterized membrane-anchored protein